MNAFCSLDMNQTASLAYDSDTYDDFPNYKWDERFNVDIFAENIDTHNIELWAKVKEAICGKLNTAGRWVGCELLLLVPIAKHT